MGELLDEAKEEVSNNVLKIIKGRKAEDLRRALAIADRIDKERIFYELSDKGERFLTKDEKKEK